MFERVLRQMREKIRTRQYVMTIHAEEEMSNDGFSIFDVERCILTGKIIDRHRDAVSAEWKYRVLGETLDGAGVEVVAKLNITGKLVFITVYSTGL